MYQFKKINEDNYKLITDKKEYDFTRTIDLTREIQSVDLQTTFIVAEFLAERGETYDNTKLRVTRTQGNQTIVDESNLKALENKARNMAYYQILDNIFKKSFGIGYLDMMNELEIISSNDEIEKFVSEFSKILTEGIKEDTPSEQNTQGNRETE